MNLELPPWIYLPTDDYDVELVYAQMEQKLVEGIGFCGWREGAINDPGKIIGERPGDADRALRQRERKVLKHSLGMPVE
jgi:hypothetical protein